MRESTGVGLQESKDIVDRAYENLSISDAKSIVEQNNPIRENSHKKLRSGKNPLLP